MKGFSLMYYWTKKYIAEILFSMLLLMFAAYTRTYIPLFIKHAVDSILDEGESLLPQFVVNFVETGSTVLIQLIFLAGTLIVFQIIRAFIIFVRRRTQAIISENVAYDMRMELYRHIQDLPYKYHNNVETGDLIQRCTTDIDNFRNFTANQFPELIRVISLLVAVIIQMSTIHVGLTLVSLLVLPVVFAFSLIYFVKIKKHFQIVEEAEGKMTTTLQENLSGVRVVKAFANEQFEIDKFDKDSKKFRDLVEKLIRRLAVYWGSSDLITTSQYCITLVVGTNLAVKGEISTGDLIAFLILVQSVIWPVRGLGRIIADFGKTIVSLGRIDEVLSQKTEYGDETEQPKINGQIEFKNVSFKFDDSNTYLLDGVSLKINKGESVALVGKTGSGKSTIGNLLVRLLDYSEGSILIDGVELNTIEKHWLRKHVGIILQEPFLFGKTIQENIAIGNKRIDQERVRQVSQVASIHKDIQGFDKGYDTLVGERGVTLSGGQKQRVAIARMLMNEKPIMIFDDSLSAVDTETDAQIRRSLKDNVTGLTMIIITHRITTAKEADKIIVLEEGKVADIGTHSELINRDGLYKTLWNIQSSLELDFNETKTGEGE